MFWLVLFGGIFLALSLLVLIHQLDKVVSHLGRIVEALEDTPSRLSGIEDRLGEIADHTKASRDQEAEARIVALVVEALNQDAAPSRNRRYP